MDLEYSDDEFCDIDSDSELGKTILSKNQKIIIIQKCLTTPTKLFEKYSAGVTRHTQNEEWQKVLNSLHDDGIHIANIKILRKNVLNWTRRATGLNDKSKRTGVGKQKQLSEFNKLCLDLLRAAKGNAAIECIAGVCEPSGCSSAIANLTRERQSCTNKKPSKSLESSASSSLKGSKHKPNEKLFEEPAPKKKLSQTGKEGAWKENFYESFQNVDKLRCDAEMKVSKLKSYNLMLRNIQLERNLGLGAEEIVAFRASVDNELNKYPQISEGVIPSCSNCEEDDLIKFEDLSDTENMAQTVSKCNSNETYIIE